MMTWELAVLLLFATFRLVFLGLSPLFTNGERSISVEGSLGGLIYILFWSAQAVLLLRLAGLM